MKHRCATCDWCARSPWDVRVDSGAGVCRYANEVFMVRLEDKCSHPYGARWQRVKEAR